MLPYGAAIAEYIENNTRRTQIQIRIQQKHSTFKVDLKLAFLSCINASRRVVDFCDTLLAGDDNVVGNYIAPRR